jgi:hypothetical protein
MIIVVTGDGRRTGQTVSSGGSTAADRRQVCFRQVLQKVLGVAATMTADADESDSKGQVRFVRHHCGALYRPPDNGSICLDCRALALIDNAQIRSL